MSRAIVLQRARAPLVLVERPAPVPGPGEVLVRVRACAVCRTDLHIADGELAEASLPIVLGHEVVGVVEALGPGTNDRDGAIAPGRFAGVPWLASTCSRCRYCARGLENLCDSARFTGYHRDGGYADHLVADARFVIPLGEASPHTAPLLCAGLIGYRSLSMTGDAATLGIYGFGAAAHIIAQVAKYQGRKVFAFTRPKDQEAQQLALSLGCDWAGDSTERPPELLEAAIIFAPAGPLVPQALSVLAKGGTVVCGGIHMSDIPAFPYQLLWGERVIRSVANLTRRDAEEFFALAPRVPVRTEVQTFPLEAANEALAALREGKIRGAAVLTV